jgi:hypothetical protein
MSGMLVIDITDPSKPQRVGALEQVFGPLVVTGNYAYVADGEAGLRVIDISKPANPQRVGGCDTSGYAGAVAVSGNYAYVADGAAGLQVIDISNPTNPRLVGRQDTTEEAWRVAVAGDYAYVGMWCDYPLGALEVIDISDPAHLRRVGGNSAVDAWDVTVAADKVFVSTSAVSLEILNLYQPPPRLESLRLGLEGFHLLLHGATGQVVRLERSRNLLTWDPFATVPIPANGQKLIDPAATTEPFLFYRAVTVP